MCAYVPHNADVFSKGPIYDGEEVEDTKKIAPMSGTIQKIFYMCNIL